MAGEIEARLAQMGVTVPEAKAPLAKYVPFVRSGNLVFVSGQLPMAEDHSLATGQLSAADHLEAGADPVPGSNMARAVEGARFCAINLIAQVKAATGDLDRVSRVVKLTGFVSSDSTFAQQHLVINGASNLLGEAFGDKGAHARAAVGSSSLPMGVMVEIEGIFEVD